MNSRACLEGWGKASGIRSPSSSDQANRTRRAHPTAHPLGLTRCRGEGQGGTTVRLRSRVMSPGSPPKLAGLERFSGWQQQREEDQESVGQNLRLVACRVRWRMCVESPCHQKMCKNVTTLVAHRGRFRKAVSHRQPRGGHGLAFGEPSPERTARFQKPYHAALTQLVGALKNHKRWGSNLRSSSLLAGFAPTAFPVHETHSKFSKPTGGRQRCFICITTQPILNAMLK